MMDPPLMSQADSDILVRNFLNRAAGDATTSLDRSAIREMLYISICAAGSLLDHAMLMRDFLVAMGADPNASIVAADDREPHVSEPKRDVEEAIASSMRTRSIRQLEDEEQIEQDIGDFFRHLRTRFTIDTTQGVACLLMSVVVDEIDHGGPVGSGLASGLPRDLAIIASVEASGYAGDQYRPHEEGLLR